MIATAIDKNGVEVEEITYLTVFNPKIKTAPINTYGWFYLDKTTANIITVDGGNIEASLR